MGLGLGLGFGFGFGFGSMSSISRTSSMALASAHRSELAPSTTEVGEDFAAGLSWDFISGGSTVIACFTAALRCSIPCMRRASSDTGSSRHMPVTLGASDSPMILTTCG